MKGISQKDTKGTTSHTVRRSRVPGRSAILFAQARKETSLWPLFLTFVPFVAFCSIRSASFK